MQSVIPSTEYRKTFLKRYAEDISELLVTARVRVESKANETQKNLEQLKELTVIKTTIGDKIVRHCTQIG